MSSRTAAPRLALVVLLALASCFTGSCGGDDTTPPVADSGVTPDAGPQDGGPADSGARDSGDVDAFVCADSDGDGHADVACGGDDCDDADGSRYPGATEVCDSDDEDCDDTTYGADADSDEFESALCCNGPSNCGADCDDSNVNVNPAAVEVCNGGIDDDCDGLADAADGVCVPCRTGYSGFDGSCTDIDECAAGTPCGVGATGCTNVDGTYVCSCGAGYLQSSPTGGLCANVNECVGGVNPCGTGTCTDNAGSYACSCPAGYHVATAPTLTCVDTDECTTATTCGGGRASCSNTEASYVCGCLTGYAAPTTGGTCADVDECATGATDAPCGVLATACVNTVGSYACTCSPGYGAPSTGGSCADLDECALGTCGAGLVSCVNTAGSYQCACGAGYASTAGQPCRDLDECATGTPCNAGHGTCANLPGSYACTCYSGYAAPALGGTCLDVDECGLNTDTCDHSPNACVNTPGTYTCICPPGFAGTGRGASGCGPRFTDLLDGSVRDNQTGLVWQQSITVDTYDQPGAVAYCASLALLGGGWHLPTIDELLGIVDPRFTPLIDPTFFPATPVAFFWSSSLAAGWTTRGYQVYSSSGLAQDGLTTSYALARCVR